MTPRLARRGARGRGPAYGAPDGVEVGTICGLVGVLFEPGAEVTVARSGHRAPGGGDGRRVLCRRNVRVSGGTRPGVARRWFVSLAERMAGLQNRVADLLSGGIEAQLASILLREADDNGRVRTTQSSLSSMLGVQRSSVQRVLKQLETAGLVALRFRVIDVVDRVGLTALLGDREAEADRAYPVGRLPSEDDEPVG